MGGRLTRAAALAAGTAGALLVAVAGCGDDGDGGADRAASPALLRLSTPAFIDGSRLPERYTCDGAGEEPPMQAGTVPPSTRELVLTVTDPDAPDGPFVHVTRYDLPSRGDGTVDEGGEEGRNGRGAIGWTPPCPPVGDPPHDYTWTVYALRDRSGLPAGATPAQVSAAVAGDDVVARGTITARYGR